MFCSVNKRIERKISRIVALLYDLTLQESQFIWNYDTEDGFLGLEGVHERASDVGFPGRREKVFVHTDAWKYALEAVLKKRMITNGLCVVG